MHRTDLAQCTRKQLLAIAKRHGLTGVSRLRKAELCERLGQALLLPPPLLPPSPSCESKVLEQSAQTVQSVIPKPPLFSDQLALAEPLLDSAPVELTLSPSQFHSTQLSPTEQPKDSSLSTSQPSAEHSEQEVTDSKFFLGSQPQSTDIEPDALPALYSDNRIVLLPRGPHEVYAYWDFNDECWTQARAQRAADDDRLVLRVSDVTYMEFTGANAWSSTDIELTPYATSWYVTVPRSDAYYCAEIGYQSRAGQFIALGCSNVVTTPRREESPSTTVRWLTPSERRTAEQQNKAAALYAPTRKHLDWTPADSGVSHLPAPSSAEYLSSGRASRKS